MRLLAVLSFAAAALSFDGCSTVQPASMSPSARVAQVVAQTPADVSLIVTPILEHNPRYAPDVLLIAQTLPGLLQNGPIDVGSVSAALVQIPGLTEAERQDLQYVSIGLPAALQIVNAVTGRTVVLYTDPNVSAIVDAFCAGLVSAARAVHPAP